MPYPHEQPGNSGEAPAGDGATSSPARVSGRALFWLVVVCVFGVLYTTAFWGRAGEWLPGGLGRWCQLQRHVIDASWAGDVLGSMSKPARRQLLWAVGDAVIGIVVPAIVLAVIGRGMRDAGIGWPNRLGRRFVLVSVILSVPFGVWLLATMPRRIALGELGVWYYVNLLRMIPEHFWICGAFVALLLPGRRLPVVSAAPVEGGAVKRSLRWVGLAQPAEAGGGNRGLAWFGLDGWSLAAILASGVVFGLVHIGKPHGLEVGLSFPGGVVVAYMTLRARSIWPAIVAHWTMNLVPLVLMTLWPG
jgi:hypothetical protein